MLAWTVHNHLSKMIDRHGLDPPLEMPIYTFAWSKCRYCKGEFEYLAKETRTRVANEFFELINRLVSLNKRDDATIEDKVFEKHVRSCSLLFWKVHMQRPDPSMQNVALPADVVMSVRVVDWALDAVSSIVARAQRLVESLLILRDLTEMVAEIDGIYAFQKLPPVVYPKSVRSVATGNTYCLEVL